MTGCYAKAKLVRENVVRKLTGLPVKREPVYVAYNPQGKTGYRWVENAQCLRVTPVHKLTRTGNHDEHYFSEPLVEHSGWYLDEFQDELVYGVVVQLPSRRRERRYVPGVSDPWNGECYLCDFTDCTSELKECIRAADRMAERYAEDEREYRERENR